MKQNHPACATLRFAVMLLACLLSSALGCSELAEVFELQDNPSNDYTCQSIGASDSRVERAQVDNERFPADRLTPSPTTTFGILALAQHAKPSPRWNPDLLHLLSIQRT